MAAARTTKRTKSATNDNDNRDRISELPEEIIHQILRRSPGNSARTTVLSKRWRSIWSCYPVVQFRHSDPPRPTVQGRLENFKKFVESSMERFSRHSQMRMETLDILLTGKFADYSPLVKQLLKFAMERKVEEISVIFRNPGLFLFSIQANFSAKILRLAGKELEEDDYQSYFLPFLASLRSLDLKNIRASLFKSLIARCPLLETLELGHINYLGKLQISGFPYLKTLKITTYYEIEIEAPGLQNLHICCDYSLRKMELRAPQLKHLEIRCLGFAVDILNAVISELPSLRTLTLNDFLNVTTKLKLSIPKLEVFKLREKCGLEEIELDAGPTLSRFVFHSSYSPEDLRKCTINNAGACCRFEANFTIPFSMKQGSHPSYLGLVKGFITRFPQFQTVCITNLTYNDNVTFNTFKEEETGDNMSNPMSIDHLKYCTVQSNSEVDKRALLEALFRGFRPNHLTLIHRHKNSKRFFQGILSIMQQKGGAYASLMWLNGLKDVKIITQDVDVEVEEEELFMGYSNCKTQNQLCLELTW
ncbi:Putative F-box/LRR-repeat protein At3g18150, partial [Linum perenne]